MRSRVRAYRLARTSGSTADLARFCALRAQTSNALDSTKNRNIASRLADAPSFVAKWRELRRLHVTYPSLPSPLIKFTVNDLNTHFTTTLNRHPPVTDLDFEAIASQPFTQLLCTIFCVRPFSQCDVSNAIQQASSKARGHDGLSVPMIKLTLPHTIPYITNLFNASIASATFPSSWKKPPSQVKSDVLALRHATNSPAARVV